MTKIARYTLYDMNYTYMWFLFVLTVQKYSVVDEKYVSDDIRENCIVSTLNAVVEFKDMEGERQNENMSKFLDYLIFKNKTDYTSVEYVQDESEVGMFRG